MKHLSDSPLLGKLLALPTNIRPYWKSLSGTNTPAYYENSKVTTVKSFITLTPGFESGNEEGATLRDDVLLAHEMIGRRTLGLFQHLLDPVDKVASTLLP